MAVWLRAGAARVHVASAWLRTPQRARADARDADEFVRRVRAGHEEVPVTALMAAAERAAALGRNRVAGELYEAALRSGAPEVLGALRRLPGYVPPIVPAAVAEAAEEAFGLRSAGTTPAARSVAPGWGLGGGVEGVVRHDFGHGRTFIRKTLRATQPREVSAYTSGLIESGGRSWRAPRLYVALEEPGGRWHLFLEDVGRIRPPRGPSELVVAARALGELSGVPIDEPSLVERASWLGQRPPPPRFARPARAASLLAGVIDDAVAARVVRTLEALAERRGELLRVGAAPPVVFGHGDPSPGNVHLREERVVLLDWGVCGPGLVGSDLGSLLRLPGRRVADDVVRRCLAEFRRGLAAAAGGFLATPEQIELGYLQRFVSMSMRRQLTQLPGRATSGLGTLLPSSRRRRSLAERNLIRICDEADRLLALLGR